MNHEGSLYLATGIDNTGLYKGKQQAVGIVKTMMREVSSFDVFSGIGVSAAAAFAIAGKQAYEFEKKFESSMLEVATLSDIVAGSIENYKNQIISLTTDSQIPIHADEAAKALYQIISAGHDGAEGMMILEASAKAAVGGITETATAADAITSLMNAYGKEAKDAEHISDLLFTTVKLGKTTMGELGKSLSQVTSVSANYGVEMEQVLAAVATLTSSGTPTAQAMTQIKQAIIGASKELGDGAFKTRTFQEGLNEISAKAKGSESALLALIPNIEAVNGIMGLTSIKAQKSASDLLAMGDAAGASQYAFEKMRESVDNQMTILTNNITASLRPLGKGILQEVSTISKGLNEAFASGDLERILKNIKGLLIAGTVAWSYHAVAINLTRIAKESFHAVAVRDLITRKANIALTKANTIAIIKQTLAQSKANAVAMLNPYTIVAASLALATYAIYKHITALSAQEVAQKQVNDRHDDQIKKVNDERSAVESLIDTLKDETKTRYDKQKALDTLKNSYPEIFANLDMEEVKNLNLTDTIKLLNIELERRNELQNEQNLKSSKDLLDKKDGAFRWSMDDRGEALELMGVDNTYWNRLNFMSNGMLDVFKEYVKESENAEKERKKIADKANETTVEGAGKTFEDINKRVLETKQNIANLENDIANLRSGKTQSSNVESDINAKEEILKKANETLKTLTGIDKSKNKDRVDQTKEVNRILHDLEMQNIKSTIDIMEEGANKQREQIKADYDIRISEIDKKEEELRDKQKGNITQRQEEELALSRKLANLVKEKDTVEVDKKESDENKEKLQKLENDWNEYYIAYGTYQEKRLAIAEDYAQKIAAAEGSVWKQASLTKERDQALQDLDVSMAQQSDLWIRLFSDAEKLTTSSLKQIIKETQSLLDYLNGVEGAQIPLGFTTEQLEALKKDPEKVKAILDGLMDKQSEFEKRNPFTTLIDGIKKYQKALAELKKAQDKDLSPEELKKLEDAAKEAMGGVANAIGKVRADIAEYGESLSKVVGAFGGDEAELNNYIDLIGGVAKAGEGAAKIFAGDIVGGIKGVVGGLADTLVSIVAISDSKRQKNIEKLKLHVEELARSYDKLGKSREKAFSTDKANIIEEQNRLAEQQIRDLDKMIYEEKKKKKTDNNAIKEMQAEQERLRETIKENKEQQKDAIAGIDIMSAIEQFAQAYEDAWTSGTDAAKKSVDVTKNILKNSLMGFLKQELSKDIEDIHSKVAEFAKDGVIDAWEQNYLDKMVDDLDAKAEGIRKNTGLDKYFDKDDDKSGVTGELKAQMTEGTGSQLVGLWNMTALDIRAIKEYMQGSEFTDVAKELNTLLNHLNNISNNTKDTADNTDGIKEQFDEMNKKLESLQSLERIEKNTKPNNSRG